jgi:hypothetical protein
VFCSSTPAIPCTGDAAHFVCLVEDNHAFEVSPGPAHDLVEPGVFDP